MIPREPGRRWAWIVVLGVSLWHPEIALAQEGAPECPNKGSALSGSALEQSLAAHTRWLADSGSGEPANFCEMNLENADLAGADLRKANLKRTRLSGASLSGANLEGAQLHGADLSRANLKGANLVDANVRKSNLEGVDLSETDSRGVILRKSWAVSAKLTGADLSGADMSKIDLQGASLKGANMQGVNLRKAILTGADLRDVNLNDSNLKKSELSGADLTGASLVGADLTGANLEGTNVEPAQLLNADGMTEEQLDATVQISEELFEAAGKRVTGAAEKVDEQAPAASVEEESAEVVVAETTETPGTGGTTSTATGEFRVQLGSFRVATSAWRAWEEVKSKHGELFQPYTASVETVDLGAEQGKWHRLRVGSLPSRSAAEALCAALGREAEPIPCLPVPPGR